MFTWWAIASTREIIPGEICSRVLQLNACLRLHQVHRILSTIFITNYTDSDPKVISIVG